MPRWLAGASACWRMPTAIRTYSRLTLLRSDAEAVHHTANQIRTLDNTNPARSTHNHLFWRAIIARFLHLAGHHADSIRPIQRMFGDKTAIVPHSMQTKGGELGGKFLVPPDREDVFACPRFHSALRGLRQRSCGRALHQRKQIIVLRYRTKGWAPLL
jgi:hypothetical protein